MRFTNLKRISSVAILVLGVVLGGAYLYASDGATAPLNTPITVTGPDGVCKKVTNASATGLSEYIPTASVAEWQSFVANPPAGVTLGSCNTPLYCWGTNSYGEVGTGTVVEQTTPAQVTLPAGISRFTSVATGAANACAIGDNGQVYCWGSGANCSLGNGSTADQYSPVPVINPPGVTSYSDLTNGSGHLYCALGNDGTRYCWGSVGYTLVVTRLCTPTTVPLPSGISSYKKLIGGIWTICGLDDAGNAYCWGLGSSGEFGDGTSVPGSTSSTPRTVTMPPGVKFTDISTGGWMVCALGTDGNVYCWGNGKSGALGNGGVANRSVPTLVSKPAGVTSFVKVVARYSGASYGSGACAIADTGDAYCWGSNANGEMGDGTNTNRLAPVLVVKPTGVTSFKYIAPSSNKTCAIGNDNKAYCWGKDVLGRGTTGTTSLIPVAVSMPSGVSFSGGASVGISTGPACAL